MHRQEGCSVQWKKAGFVAVCRRGRGVATFVLEEVRAAAEDEVGCLQMLKTERGPRGLER
jgi:hypothetical protein